MKISDKLANEMLTLAALNILKYSLLAVM